MRIVVAETDLSTAYMPQLHWTLFDVVEVDPEIFACISLGIEVDSDMNYNDYFEEGLVEEIDDGENYRSYYYEDLWENLEDEYGRYPLVEYLNELGIEYDEIYYEDELLDKFEE